MILLKIGAEMASSVRVMTNDGETLFVRVCGRGNRHLLLMHGWAGSSRYFDALIGSLDLARVRVMAPDLRGHGASSKPSVGYDDERLADDALCVADAVSADRFYVLGYSMSGRFAQAVSARAPERVLGQVLVAGCPARRLALSEELVMDWVGRAGDAERLREVTAGLLSCEVAPETLDEIGRHAALASAVALEETLRLTSESDLSTNPGAGVTPTLVVAGAHDPIFPAELLRRELVERLPGARLEILDSNHEIPIERPRELAALVEQFMERMGNGV